MNTFNLIAPCHFGLESVLKREIFDLGYDIKEVEDGRVTFTGDAEAICRTNIHLRTTERVLIQVGRFKATTYDELFEGIKALNWEDYIPEDGKFWVAKATSIKSKLFSPSDIQSIIKKAMVERLKKEFEVDWFEETGASFPLRVTIMKDMVSVGLDTSGDSLHKRGYRLLAGKAPISETLAAALIKVTPWREDRILVDPFCGSGTFLIEAAMMAAHIAPGLNRKFVSMDWEDLIPKNIWDEAMEEAHEDVDVTVETHLQGYDVNEEIIQIARENARRAGVGEMIHFQRRSVAELHHPKKYGFIITNPPYGERMEDKEDLPVLYKEIGEAYKGLDSWSMYLISAYEDAEKDIGRKADKNRKIYNGMIKTYFYQYIGPKPPKKPRIPRP